MPAVPVNQIASVQDSPDEAGQVLAEIKADRGVNRMPRTVTLQSTGIGVGASQYLQSGPFPRPIRIRSAILLSDVASPNISAQIGWSQGSVTDEASRLNGTSIGAGQGSGTVNILADAIPMTSGQIKIDPLGITLTEPGVRLYMRGINNSGTPNITMSVVFVIETNPADESAGD